MITITKDQLKKFVDEIKLLQDYPTACIVLGVKPKKPENELQWKLDYAIRRNYEKIESTYSQISKDYYIIYEKIKNITADYSMVNDNGFQYGKFADKKNFDECDKIIVTYLQEIVEADIYQAKQYDTTDYVSLAIVGRLGKLIVQNNGLPESEELYFEQNNTSN